jgi:uncharacterized protein YhbP (UPF0306 family)
MATPDDIAREILAANRYMTLATADEHGTPWAAPVYYAAAPTFAELYWVSDPEARHSRNLARRPRTGIVVFDSTVAVGHGQAVYMEAAAGLVPDEDFERALAIYPGGEDAKAFTPDELRAPARLRLYRAAVTAHWILDGHDRRIAVSP